jgi:GNAT superfamily N-acetyltransferase
LDPAQTQDIRIRAMLPSEAPRVADLHREGIPQGFLSYLSARFRTVLYRGIAQAPQSGVWVAVDGRGEIIGFLSGTADVSRCYRSVLASHGIALAVAMLGELRRPTTWRQAWQTLTYPRREFTASGGADAPLRRRASTGAELLSVVVSAGGRGTGTAARLVEALETELRDWGHRGSYRVATIAGDARANAFYRKVGFRHLCGFQHHGVDMNLYHKDLPE